MKLLYYLDLGAEKLLDTIKRFPLATLSILLLTLFFLLITEGDYIQFKQSPYFDIVDKVAFTLTLGIPLFIAIRLIFTNHLWSLLGVVLLVFYYTTLPPSLDVTHINITRHIIFISSSILLIFIAPFTFRNTPNDKIWAWIRELLFAIIVSLIFATVLYIGFLGISYAFEKLFSIKLAHHYTLEKDIVILTFFLFALYYFLSQVPKKPLFIKYKEATRAELILVKYILTPLVAIYFVILYAYTAKVLLLDELPKGVISWLVLSFSALAIVTYLFWTELWDDKNSRYRKWIWLAILLQTFMLGFSIYLRIEQYGVTENRYFIAVMGGWLFITSLYFLLFRNASYRWIFISLALLGVVTQLSPFSAIKLSEKSQVAQLQKLLSTQQSLTDESNITLRYQISNKIEYLFRKGGIEALLPVLPKIVQEYQLQTPDNKDCAINTNQYFPNYATKALGFKFIDRWEWQEEISSNKRDRHLRLYTHHQDKIILEVKGYDYLIDFDFVHFKGKEIPMVCENEEGKSNSQTKETPQITIETQSNAITISKSAQKIATISLESFLKKIQEYIEKSDKSLTHRYGGIQLPEERLTYLYEDQKVKVKLLMRTLTINPKGRIESYRGGVLIKEK